MFSLDGLAADVRHGFRALRRDRAFTLTALVIFALCLGANVALFAVVNAVLIRPLPFPHAEQLVTVYNSYPKAGVDRAGSSVPHYLERRAGIAAFAESAAVRDSGNTIGEPGATERIDALRVTPSFFRVLGVSAALGRTFEDSEGEEGRNQVVILSDALWRSRFGSDPHVIGRPLRMDGGTQVTIVGVMPPDFRYLTSRAQLWTPLVFSADSRKPDSRHSNNMSMIARLRPGVSVATAQAQVYALNQSTTASDPYAKLVSDAGFTAKVVDLHADAVAKTRALVLLLQAGVLLLLLIGLVNLTNLLLVRVTARTKELSIRQVLGASATQLARQIAAESVLLSLGGGLIGIAVGWVALRSLSAVGADKLPHTGNFTIDATVGFVAVTASVLIGLVLATPAIWQTRQRNLSAALSVESRGGTTSRSTHRLRHALIAAQFSLAFVLLVSAGLLGLSFAKVLAVNPGFQPSHVFTAVVPLPRSHYQDEKQRIAFVQRLAQELAAAPGVTAAGFGSMMPFADADVNGVSVEGHVPKPGESLQAHYMGGVTGDYFAALGIPLREGRLLTADDTARGAKVCVVDEQVARYYWPNGGAIGAHLYNGISEATKKPFTVVGIVGSIKQNDLADQRGRGVVYLPFSEYVSRDISVAIRTVQAPEAAGPLLRAAVRRVDPELPIADVKTLAARIDDTLEARRSPVLLASLFSTLALLLVSVGLYGVLAYAVSQRRREIGVRMALGARPVDIRTQFLGLGARLALIGAALGGVAAWWSGRALNTLLFGVTEGQIAVYAVTALTLSLVALAACFVPAARAARVPPMEALRSE